ncbi:MAG: DUF2461 family protein [Candidatus Eisenbacteria bacterium]
MAKTRTGWKKGSIGYPGVDLTAFGRALAAAFDAPRAGLGIAVGRALEFKGAGRGFVTGALNLWSPAEHALVNGAVVAAFEQVDRRVTKATWQSLRKEATREFRIPAKSRSTERLLAVQLLLEEVRLELGLEDFLELDWILLRLSKSTGVKPGTSGHDGDHGFTPTELIESFLDQLSAEQVTVREQSVAEARELIEANLGRLTTEQVTRILRLWSTDFYGGRAHINRFSPAFVGANRNQVVSKIDAVNEWVERLWTVPEDKVEELLDQFSEAGEIPGAGVSLPTTLLHTRDPERWFPFTVGLRRGYEAITEDRLQRTRKASNYIRYAQRLRDLVEMHQIPPAAVDLLLFEASKAATDKGPGPTPALSFDGFTEETFRFFRDLEQNNSEQWYDERQRARFQESVKTKLTALVADLKAAFIDRIAPHLEHEPKSPNPMSRIRKNVFGRKEEGAYWTHLWVAFHRPDLSKNEDFQLYVFLSGSVCAYGMFTGSAKDEERKQLSQRILERADSVGPILEKLTAEGVVIKRSTDYVDSTPNAENGGLLGTAQRAVPESVRELAEILEGPAFIGRELTPEEAVERGPELVSDVAGLFETLYPLYALATQGEGSVDDGGETEPDYTREEFLEETLLEEEELDTILALLEDKPQLILYGPPGTGKTWLAERLGRLLAGDDAGCRIVQFHPSYSYEDFVEGIRPSVEPTTGQIRYDVKPGVFRRLCDEARKQPQKRYILVIDEINRGNLPRIFGELLYLLERRGKRIELAVSGEGFSVPRNLYLIGTMNTADQSIALVDAALRRRFHFKELIPDPQLLERWLRARVPDRAWVSDLLVRLNDELRKLGIDANLAIGHSHFMDPLLDDVRLARIWDHSIIPTLQEYFYGQPERIDALRYEEFVVGFSSATVLEAVDPEADDDVDDPELIDG